MRRSVVAGLVLATLAAAALPGRATTPGVGRIAFNAGGYRAYVSGLDGSVPRELPRPAGASGISTWPSWSPDGTQVAYGVEGCGSTSEYALQLAVLDDCLLRAGLVQIAPAGGRAAKTVFSMPATYVWTVDWARKGGRIAVEVAPTNASTASLVYVTGANGSGQHLLGPGERPAWAPDGRRLAFLNPADQGLYVVDVDSGDDPVRVSPAGIGGGREEPRAAPAWSPDGRRIAFLGWPSSGEPQVWVVDSTGGGGRALPGTDYASWSPSWSPDSRRLAVMSAGGISIVRADGSGRRRILRTTVPTDAGAARLAEGASWSPDGRWIAFLYADRATIFDERRSLRLIRPDGTGLHQAVDLGSSDDSVDNEWFAADAPLVWAPRISRSSGPGGRS
jgi:Tol biopolymer transport system component